MVMENYLIIIVSLMVFFLVIMIYLRYFYSKFTPSDIPGIKSLDNGIVLKQEPNVYETEDTRMDYSELAPVNPIVKKSKLYSVIPANYDLYSSSDIPLLNEPPVKNTNELIYSGGQNQMISIPLQMNEPHNNEQLRSQKILVTPYNKIKYGTC
jgi:hypothetical protein